MMRFQAAQEPEIWPKKKNRIFISWSGTNSGEFAKGLKHVIEERVFPETGLECFVSNEDIASGTDWWTEIKEELKSCTLGILCVTRENVAAPWIFYEAGGMAARGVPSIPLLICCDVNSISGSPLHGKQCVLFDEAGFIKLIEDINKKFNTLLPPQVVKIVAKTGYEELAKDMTPILKRLNSLHVINAKDTYPRSVTTVKHRTLYLSVPMASINEEEYIKLHDYILKLVQVLTDIGFTEIHSSALDIDNFDAFDGGGKAINDNFKTLKEVDSILLIYPWKSASSSLVDIGYGIALCKKIVIFYKEGLPYILDEAGTFINHVKTYSFKKYEDITKTIKSNGMVIFEGGNDA